MPQLLNTSTQSFAGWRRCVVSDRPSLDAGITAGGATFVVGRAVGIAGYAVDVHCAVGAGQRITMDLGKVTPLPAAAVVPTLPPAALADPVGYFGVPTVAGVPLSFVSMEPDGACLLVHLRRRLSMIVVDLWLHVYPDVAGIPMQQWATGVLQLTCSDVSKPDLQQPVPFDVRFEVGGATVDCGMPASQDFDERGDSDLILRAGDYFGDGQAKRWPVRITWGRNTDYASSIAESKVHAFGLSRIGPLGKPAQQGGLNVRAWLASRLPKCEAAIGDWSAPWNIGVPANSTQTGDEEEQGFSQGFEPFYEGGLPAVRTRWLEALIQGRRPCHHLEHDGAMATPEMHPDCVFWQGRPHWNAAVSPDQFHKPKSVGASNSHGWFGPDREHWLLHTTAAAYEMTGCPALQNELRHQANCFLFGETVRPGWSTSSTDAARSAGYAGLVALHLWRLLDDRALAQRVKQRFLDRLSMVYVPRWGHLDWWQWVPTYSNGKDASGQPIRVPTTMGAAVGMNYPYAVMAYQQAVGAFGLYLAARTFGHQDGMALAMRGARAVWLTSYHEGKCYETLGLTDQGEFCGSYVEGDGAHSSLGFYTEWTPLAVWVCAQEDSRAVPFYEALCERAAAGARDDRTLDWTPSL